MCVLVLTFYEDTVMVNKEFGHLIIIWPLFEALILIVGT